MDYGLVYSGDPSILEGYTDASWITDKEDYASMSGWLFTLGGGAVSWGLKKQSCLTDSTMAAEFVALASCCKEAEWLRDLKRVNWKILNGIITHVVLGCLSYGNILNNVHLSEYGSEAASYELKGLDLKHSKKPRYRPKASLNGLAQSALNQR
ncbi:hypothetical protein Tco_0364997 [Tanacetum coccineum]